MIEMWILVGLAAVAGYFAGTHTGYRLGIEEVVAINDASYQKKLSADTEELRKRADIETETNKKRFDDALAFEKSYRAMGGRAVAEEPDKNKLLTMPTKGTAN